MNLLAKVLHGSHLYGLDTESSDKDYKGIYLPSMREMVLCNVKSSFNFSTNKSNEKNTVEDTDYEVYSIQKYAELLCKGEMVAFDMLFSPDSFIEWYDKNGNVISAETALKRGNPFAVIRENRGLYLHSNMKAYLGYVRKQASKYGIKGSRLACLREVLDSVSEINSNVPLHCVADIFPENKYCYWVTLSDGLACYSVLGKQHQANTSLPEFKKRIQRAYKEYGNRAKLAEQNDGVDWKAVSHALRASRQLVDMFKLGKMVLPLPETSRQSILDVKLGNRDWGEVKGILERSMDLVERLSKESNLPETVDKEQSDRLVFKSIMAYIYGGER